YSVVANARNITKTNPFPASPNLALVDGDISDPNTAAKIANSAVSRFGRIDALVNNAGIFFSKHFTDYTLDDLRCLSSVNIEGFSQDAPTDGTDFRCERHRGRDRLSHGSPSGNRGGAARGRRCARWQMVTREDSQSASAEQRLKELASSSRRRRSALTWKRCE